MQSDALLSPPGAPPASLQRRRIGFVAHAHLAATAAICGTDVTSFLKSLQKDGKYSGVPKSISLVQSKLNAAFNDGSKD